MVLYPTVAGGLYAFTDWTGRAGGANFVGLDNFRQLLTAESARSALVNTLLIAAACTVVQTAAGLGLALALNTRLRSRNILRTLFFASALLPPLIIGFLWQYVLTPTGPLNTALDEVGLGALKQNWLGDGSIALGSVIAIIIWQNAGLTMVIYLAGLQGVPAELYEAAAIDGAGVWQRFRSVTLPLLLPATTIALSLTLIGSLKLFDQVFAMTGGGPGYATETLAVVMYKEAFVSGEFGYSAAIALVLTMLVFAFAMVQLRTLRRFEVDT
ncbi:MULTISPECIES: carbohydrate ABC transporter permease [unclassified Streptomyces]|uniref:carbohydrate ABC transporter permease n=1 Tax=unclassified Streptomyces TaxID=2593676 RepID=UPI0020A68A6B|nr:sugar ABC transporter permease [Streptomyces sp. CNQ-509]